MAAVFHLKLLSSINISLSFICSSDGPCGALAFLFGFINIIRHVTGLLWMSDQLITKASTDTRQHNIYTQTNNQQPSGQDLCLRPRCHQDRLNM